MSILFISDLHLDPTRPAVTRAFLDLVEQQAPAADALYILGDFFEVWIGDDDDAELNQIVIAALKNLTQTQTPVYLMHGNRDFLMGEYFCQQSGCQLINDPSVVNLYGSNVLLMHGDSLCIDDTAYMTFRAQSRSQEWQAGMLSLPIEQRRALAKQMRDDSQQANSNKAADIMDVNQEEVIKVMEHYQVDCLIHGHTHRPAIHPISLDNNNAHRIVLGDWHNSGWLLRYHDDHSYQLEEFAIPHSN